MKRRRPQERPTRTCLTCGCGAVIVAWKWLCDPCFRRLPFDQRRAIAQAGQDKAPHRVAELARAGAAWLEQHNPAAEAARRFGEAVDG